MSVLPWRIGTSPRSMGTSSGCNSVLACSGLEGIVSKRKGSANRSSRSPDWLKMKNPDAPAVKRGPKTAPRRGYEATREAAMAAFAKSRWRES